MATDYDKIREDNIREYGEGTRLLSLLGRLYTDRTHFIFELLQNAEDAGASKVHFKLYRDRLEVAHNGRRFNERDVRGLCGVGEGTKSEDLTQIGKFGIGFKSVYTYTATPEVYSGDEAFRIENYVRPYSIPSRAVDRSWTTLFVFPFRSGEIQPEPACNEIGTRLRNLSARTLLFLRKINEVEYVLQDSSCGIYLREEFQRGSARQVTVVGQVGGSDEEESWLIFQRPVPGYPESVCVEVAFLLDSMVRDREKNERIIKAKDTPLVVYFPTEKETRFGFLIQGPYRTTPSRDNIPRDDDYNRSLVIETAKLIKHVLLEIKTLSFLSVSFLEALPIRTEDFQEDDMFYPIVESVRSTLLEEELLPCDNGSFVSARNAKLARGVDLRKLLTQVRLNQLYRSSAQINWLTGDITQDRTQDLRSYLIQKLNVEEVSPEVFARNIDDEFLFGQPEKWFIDLYKYLNGHQALWKKTPPGILRSKPILRLEDGSQIAPFKSDGSTAQAFLPSLEKTTFPTVSQSIVDDEEAKIFLKQLGLSEPNAFDGILENVLPNYTVAGKLISEEDHQADISKIVSAMNSDLSAGRDNFIKKARETPFLKAKSSLGNIQFKRPGELYLDTSELRSYFCSTHEVWFMHEKLATSNADSDVWCELGVSSCPRKLQTSKGLPEEEREKSTGPETITNYELEGLDQFLKSIDECANFEEQWSLSFKLWNFLRELWELDVGNRQFGMPDIFNAQYRWFYYTERTKFFDSIVLCRLKDTNWIPSKNRLLKKPSETNNLELFDEFLVATSLIERLGIVQIATGQNHQYAEQLGISLEDIEFLKNHHYEIKQLKENLALRKEPPKFPVVQVQDSERRRQKIRDYLSNAPEKKYAKKGQIQRTTKNAIDPHTSLRNLYTNEFHQMICQICKEEMPFRKRNTEHYFEAIEVLSQKYLQKEHAAQYLALCPLCAAKFNEFIKSVEAEMDQLKERIANTDKCKIPISFNQEDTSILFVETHFHDLKVIIAESNPTTK